MSTKPEHDRGPVVVKITVTDWVVVPRQTYETTVEYDREDWELSSPEMRKAWIDEDTDQFMRETFELGFEVLHGDDIDHDCDADDEPVAQ